MSVVDLAAAALNLASRTLSVEVRRGIRYGGHSRQTLDFYGPPTGRTIVFFYGGGWVKGTKEMYEFVGRSLAVSGITTVIPDYRLRQHGAGDAATEDGAAAVSWAWDNLRRPLVIAGHSAGAHIAASLALSADWASWAESISIAGFAGLAGPYRYLGRIKGSALPPALLLTAGRDRLISADEATTLAAQIRARRGQVATVDYPAATHATLVGALSPLLQSTAPVRAQLLRFVHEHT